MKETTRSPAVVELMRRNLRTMSKVVHEHLAPITLRLPPSQNSELEIVEEAVYMGHTAETWKECLAQMEHWLQHRKDT